MMYTRIGKGNGYSVYGKTEWCIWEKGMVLMVLNKGSLHSNHNVNKCYENITVNTFLNFFHIVRAAEKLNTQSECLHVQIDVILIIQANSVTWMGYF